jgi:hypothetical protein
MPGRRPEGQADMKINLEKFAHTLPYASEIFGIYQPLLGWKSKRVVRRINDGLQSSFNPAVLAIASSLTPAFHHASRLQAANIDRDRILPATGHPQSIAYVNTNLDSFVARIIVERINTDNLDIDDDGVWAGLVSEPALLEILAQVTDDPALAAETSAYLDQNRELGDAATTSRTMPINRESLIAGTLLYLYHNQLFSYLREIFRREPPKVDVEAALEMRKFVDPLESFDPQSDLDRVALSPVGIVNLFREYFFEFDTFLGPPVQHIWLSPGSSLELIEVSTRKTTIERTAETVFQTVTRSEHDTTDQEELSGAIKEENSNNTKLATSVSAGAAGGATTEVFSATAHVDATASYGFDTSSKISKESAYKNLRTQTNKLSTEITSNFKTTFKTVTETTDISSKRYVLQNTTMELINYELRRKMRQIGVQVQDIGTQLCWQTYVDLPAKHLGLSNLVHIAEPPDYSKLHAPTPIPPPANVEKDLTITLAFQGTGHDNDTNAHYVEDGPDSEFGHPDNGDVNDKVRINYHNYAAPSIPSFDLVDIRLVTVADNKLAVPEFSVAGPSSFNIHLRSVKYDGDSVTVQIKLVYKPDMKTQTAIDAANATAAATFDAEKQQLAHQTLLKEARDRVDAAASVKPRRLEDLREEERIIVYRELMGDLLNVGALPNEPRVRHVLAELISSMFDVDRMLYFVAPDWWVPRKVFVNRQEISPQHRLERYPNNVFTKDDVVTWGSAGDNRRQNYFITETSQPAKLGASIGWVMQLDGDNLRNAFLNAPWVKAVIPIRPGKELAALSWLTHASVEGSDGLDARYQERDQAELDEICATLETFPWTGADDIMRFFNFAARVRNEPGLFVSIRDALRYLAIRIKRKNDLSVQVQTDTVDGEVSKYLPTEKVFEHGFDPLAGAFEADGEDPFTMFSQWVEIMPTDQVVAVEVTYDPKTGMQL